MVVRFFCVIRVLVCARVSRVCVPPPPGVFSPRLTTVSLREVGTGGEGGGGVPEKCAEWKTSKTQKTSRGGLAPSRPLGQ